MSETKPMTAVAKRLIDRADSHDRMAMGSAQHIGFYSTWDAQLMREAATHIQELESELAGCRECRANLDCLSRGAVPVRDDGAEILVGITAVIQYRNKRELGPWKTMAAFDVMGPAEKYFADQRTEADWPWEYRLVDLNEDTAK